MSGQKAIRDSIHGNINIEGLILELMGLPEMQRLHSIRQLGFTYLVYPGANHTRLEHSLGTYYVAGRMADAIFVCCILPVTYVPVTEIPCPVYNRTVRIT